jgi:hypothetical protein
VPGLRDGWIRLWPLLLADDDGLRSLRSFNLKISWTCVQRFEDIVRPRAGHSQPYQNLFDNIKDTEKKLLCGDGVFFSKNKMDLRAAILVLLQPSIAHENSKSTWPSLDLS